MGIKTSSSGQKGNSNNNKSKKTRRRQGKQSLIQTLFDTCKELFANGGVGFVPTADDVARVCSVLDRLKPSDVGLTPELPYFRTVKTEPSPRIAYLHLHECEKFSMGIFCLPPSGVLPLHNHPGMTVFSKLLLGTMHIQSYDWATDVSSSSNSNVSGAQRSEASTSMRLAKLKVNGEITAPCDTSILYPANGGNMHCFTAVTACAVLDVLTPPYSDPDGRHCAYYHQYPFDNFSGIKVAEEEKERYSWLAERDRPKDLVVVGAKYTGPKIIKT